MILFLIGFQVLGPMHASRSLVVSPDGLFTSLEKALILNECVPEWDSKMHYSYTYFAAFQISGSSGPPYNVTKIYDNTLPDNVCGETTFIPDSTGNYVETYYVELNYNPDRGWHWNYGSGHPVGTVHFKTAVKHEIGHMIGLADEPGISPPDSAIMYPKIDSFPRYIRKDDIEGVCCIYGDVNGDSMEQYTIVDSPRTIFLLITSMELTKTVYHCGFTQDGYCLWVLYSHNS